MSEPREDGPVAANGCEVCGRRPAPGGFCSEECVRVDAQRRTAATLREYEVVLTMKEHYSVWVEAASAVEARSMALRGEYDFERSAQHGDREIIGARARADTDA